MPIMSPPLCAPVAQLDRASDYESEGRTFESFRARQFSQYLNSDFSPKGGPAEGFGSPRGRHRRLTPSWQWLWLAGSGWRVK